MKIEIIISGFGGQGILFAGNLLAWCALGAGYYTTYLPVYGPEMRGGTCNCTVIISDEEIASPVSKNPSFLMIMNFPSFEKFINRLKKGGKALINSDLVPPESIENLATFQKKYKLFFIPVNTLAEKIGAPSLANICMLGGFYAITKIFDKNQFETALKKVLGDKKAHLFEPNLKAFEIGASYIESSYSKGKKGKSSCRK